MQIRAVQIFSALLLFTCHHMSGEIFRFIHALFTALIAFFLRICYNRAVPGSVIRSGGFSGRTVALNPLRFFSKYGII